MKSNMSRIEFNRRVRWVIATGLVLILTTPSAAMAYIDPISGSIVLQVLAAGFFAGSLAFRRIRERIARGFHSMSRRSRR
jgi:hypothetical protein